MFHSDCKYTLTTGMLKVNYKLGRNVIHKLFSMARVNLQGQNVISVLTCDPSNHMTNILTSLYNVLGYVKDTMERGRVY